MRHICGVASEPSFWERLALSAGGALIGLAGLFTVWWLTQRATRRRESQTRVSESVALVIEAGTGFNRRRGQSLADAKDMAAAVMRLGDALTLFGAREVREFPAVARLAFEHASTMVAWAEKLEAERTSAGIRATSDAVARLSGSISGSLLLWLQVPKSEGLPPAQFPPDGS